MKSTEILLSILVLGLIGTNIYVIKELHEVNTQVNNVEPQIEIIVSDIQAVVDKIKELIG